MRADYDSEADVLAIDLRTFERIALLSPGAHIDLLVAAAELYELDGTALVATAQAALAAPDRIVELKVGAPLAA